MAKKQIEWTEELLNQYTAPYGLDKLDRDSKITIANMLISENLRNYRLNPNIVCSEFSSYQGIAAIYSQNYIIMRLLQEQKKQNQRIIEQNDQIIVLLTKMSEKK